MDVGCPAASRNSFSRSSSSPAPAILFYLRKANRSTGHGKKYPFVYFLFSVCVRAINLCSRKVRVKNRVHRLISRAPDLSWTVDLQQETSNEPPLFRRLVSCHHSHNLMVERERKLCSTSHSPNMGKSFSSWTWGCVLVLILNSFFQNLYLVSFRTAYSTSFSCFVKELVLS